MGNGRRAMGGEDPHRLEDSPPLLEGWERKEEKQ